MANIQKRGKRWRAQVRKSGHPYRSKTFIRKTDAQTWAHDLEVRMERAEFVPTQRVARMSVADLIDWYIEDILPNKRHGKDQAGPRQRLQVWRDICGRRLAGSLTADQIKDAVKSAIRTRKTRAGAPVSESTVNRYLASFSAVYTAAVKLDRLADNPVKKVERGAENSGMVRFLHPDEINRLLEVCKGYLDRKQSTGNRNAYPYITLALTTGLRRGDLEPLTWDRVDLDHEQLAVPTGKHDVPRYVPLVEPALSALKNLRAQRDDDAGYVFTGHKKGDHFSASHLWTRIREDANLPGVRLHDLRHTAGTHLSMAGASTIQIAHQLGHRGLSMAQRYAHQTAEFSRRNAQRMVQHMLQGSDDG